MISILLPSRKRPELLIRCLSSIANNASNPASYEVCLRLHRDDLATIKLLPIILQICPVRVVIGFQHNGYNSLAWFYQECAAISRGDYVWIANDDVTVNTPGWDDVFKEYVRTKKDDAIVMPQTLIMGGSKYIDWLNNPFMFLPNKCWERCGMPRFVNQFDAALWTLLRQHGWRTDFVPIEVEHSHDPERNLKERAKELSPDYATDPHEHYMENL